MYQGHLTRVTETLPEPYLCTSPSAQCVDLSSLLLKPRLTALFLSQKGTRCQTLPSVLNPLVISAYLGRGLFGL